MYYITKKTSETGKKFQEIIVKRNKGLDEQKAFSKKHGFNTWRAGWGNVFGGISSCVGFDEKPDKKVWGKGVEVDEYMPKNNTKLGKLITAEINEMTIVTKDELNQCVGFNGAPFKTIGFAQSNEVYFGFGVGEDWDFTPPEDCEEILTSKYRELFTNK